MRRRSCRVEHGIAHRDHIGDLAFWLGQVACVVLAGKHVPINHQPLPVGEQCQDEVRQGQRVRLVVLGVGQHR